MNLSFEPLMLKIRRAVMVQGMSIDEMIKELHDQGLTITETIKVLMSVHRMSLREAKMRVSTHPVWKPLTQATESLHQELLKIVGRSDSPPKR